MANTLVDPDSMPVLDRLFGSMAEGEQPDILQVMAALNEISTHNGSEPTKKIQLPPCTDSRCQSCNL